MRKVIVSESVSLDGVMESPDKWHFPYFNDEMGQAVGSAMAEADAMLMGHVLYEEWTAFWPNQDPEENPFAAPMNGIRKYVVSTTLEEPLEWSNSTLIKENVAEEISRLKEQPGKDISISGSGTRVFRGEGLMPLGIDALFEMGLGGALESVPGRMVDSWNIWIDSEEVFVVPESVEQLGKRAVRIVSQPALIAKVVQEASRYPSFSFEQGARVRNLIHDAGGRVIGAKLETEDGPREARADLVLGCDGRGSLVRTRADLDLELLPEHYDVLWFKLPAPEALREGCSIMMAVAAKKHPIICYTSWDGRMQYGVVMPKRGLRGLREKDWVSESVGSAPAWLAEHVLAKRDEIEGPSRLNVVVGRALKWSAPGLLLLGDAAHPMSPVRAQGINLALRDAVVAANHLVPHCRKGAEASALDAACWAVQVEREPEIARAQRLQVREARGQGDARSGSWRFGVAKRGARLLGRYRWAQSAWFRRQHELRFGSMEVKLRVAT